MVELRGIEPLTSSLRIQVFFRNSCEINTWPPQRYVLFARTSLFGRCCPARNGTWPSTLGSSGGKSPAGLSASNQNVARVWLSDAHYAAGEAPQGRK